MKNATPLFASGFLSDYLRNIISETQKTIAGLSAKQINDANSLSLVIERMKTQASLKIPVLLEDKIEAQDSEVQVEAPSHFRNSYHNERRMVKATKIEIIVPYIGDDILFKLSPSSFNLNPPRAFINSKKELILTYILYPGEDIAKVKQDYPATLRVINGYLQNLGRESSTHNASIATIINAAVEKRRAEVESTQSMVNELGLKIRPKQ